MIVWIRRFFVGCYSTGYGDISIKAVVSFPPSGTMLQFSCPLLIILYSHVSTFAILVVLHICYHPYPPSPSSSRIYFVVPIIPPPHLFWFWLNLSASPPPYLLPSLSVVPVISCFWFHCNYQPDSTLHFSSSIFSIIPHLCLRHPCYPTYLQHFFCLCLHRPVSLPLTSP